MLGLWVLEVGEEEVGVGEVAGGGDGAEGEELGGDGRVVLVAVGYDLGVDFEEFFHAVAALKEVDELVGAKAHFGGCW